MYSPMEPTFTGFTLAVNQIALAIANAQQAPATAVARLAPQASPAREVGSGLVRYQADPDSAYPLASPIHGDVRDPGQCIPVHPLGTVRADGSQQRDRDRRDGPGRAVLDLHRPAPDLTSSPGTAWWSSRSERFVPEVHAGWVRTASATLRSAEPGSASTSARKARARPVSEMANSGAPQPSTPVAATSSPARRP